MRQTLVTPETERLLRKWGLFVAGAAAATLAQTALESHEYVQARLSRLMLPPLAVSVLNAFSTDDLRRLDKNGEHQDIFWLNLKANAYRNAVYAAAPAALTPLTATAAEVEAARRIQRAWWGAFRWRTTGRLLMRHFIRAPLSTAEYRGGPTRERAVALGFHALVVELRSKEIIAVTRDTLQRIHALCTFGCRRRHRDAGAVETGVEAEDLATVNVRVFLAAYMIACRPVQVFETTTGALEKPLHAAAVRLLAQFEQICAALLAQPVLRRGSARPAADFSRLRAALVDPFVSLLVEYLRRFNAWKVPDEAKLTQRIKHALVALYQARCQLPPGEPENSALRRELETQIARLREKLRTIAGGEELARFDAQHAELILQSAQPRQPQQPQQQQQQQEGYGVPAHSGRITNEALAHELLLNPAFQLTDDGDVAENPVAGRIRATFHRAFWDSLADDLRLAGGPCYVRTLRVLREIRDGLIDVNGPRAAIDEVLDLDFIQGQVDAGTYTWANCCNLVKAVYGLVRRIMAPRRDADVTRRWREDVAERMPAAAEADRAHVFCGALEFLLQCVSFLRIDAANARLRLIAPVVRDHGVEYERGKLNARLASHELTLQRTRLHIRAATANDAALLDDLLSGAANAYARIHASMVLNIVVAPDAELHAFGQQAAADGVPAQGTGLLGVVPETLLYDARRFEWLRHEFDFHVHAVVHLVVSEHMLATTAAAAAASAASAASITAASAAAAASSTTATLLSLQAELGAFFANRDNSHGVGEFVQGVVARMQERLLPPPSSTADEAQHQQQQRRRLKAFVDMVAQWTDPANSVNLLIRARVANTWRFILLHDGSYPTRATAPELTVMYGAASVLRERILDAVRGTLLPVVRVNRAAHTDHYNALIREAAAEAAAAAAAAASAAPTPPSQP